MGVENLASAQYGVGDDIGDTSVLNPGVGGVAAVDQEDGSDVVEIRIAVDVNGLRRGVSESPLNFGAAHRVQIQLVPPGLAAEPEPFGDHPGKLSL